MFAAILLTIIPYSPIIEDRVSVYEVNHFYDDAGQPIFTQRIFYEWSDEAERYNVVAWRMVKRDAPMSRDRQVVFFDYGDGGGLRRIRFASFMESWTQYDPELLERERLPSHQRKGLSERP